MDEQEILRQQMLHQQNFDKDLLAANTPGPGLGPDRQYRGILGSTNIDFAGVIYLGLFVVFVLPLLIGLTTGIVTKSRRKGWRTIGGIYAVMAVIALINKIILDESQRQNKSRVIV